MVLSGTPGAATPSAQIEPEDAIIPSEFPVEGNAKFGTGGRPFVSGPTGLDHDQAVMAPEVNNGADLDG